MLRQVNQILSVIVVITIKAVADKIDMSKRVTGKDKAFQDILKILQVKEWEGNALLIVSSTMLRKLVDGVPDNELSRLLSAQLAEPQVVESLPLSQWVKTVRSQLGLSQRKFAALLQEKGVKVYGSDIGNLELNLRSDDYREGRREKIKAAIEAVLRDRNKVAASTVS